MGTLDVDVTEVVVADPVRAEHRRPAARRGRRTRSRSRSARGGSRRARPPRPPRSSAPAAASTPASTVGRADARRRAPRRSPRRGGPRPGRARPRRSRRARSRAPTAGRASPRPRSPTGAARRRRPCDAIGPRLSSVWSMWSTPNEGTSPCVAFRPTRPHCAAGIRVLPPESAPIARSASPAATAAAEPPRGAAGGVGRPERVAGRAEDARDAEARARRSRRGSSCRRSSRPRRARARRRRRRGRGVRERARAVRHRHARDGDGVLHRDPAPGERPAVGAVDLADADEGVDRILVDGRPTAGLAGVPHRDRQVGKILDLVEEPQERRPRSPRRHPPRGRARSRRGRRALQVVDRRRPQVAHVARVALHRGVTPQPYCAARPRAASLGPLRRLTRCRPMR